MATTGSISVSDPATAATTTTPLINTQTATAAAVTGAGFINAATSQIVKAQADGPFTFRILGLIGGLAMVLSNGIAILDRFFSFNFAGAMIAVYGVFFGIIIVMLEGPFPFKERIQGGIRFHAKFLEFTWGRGALYFFVGTLQISNWNMLDWAVGGFMIFVGITAIGAGIASARDLKLLKFSMADEVKLKEQFTAHDSNGDRRLDVKELTAFVRESGIEMNRNEIAAVFLALGTVQSLKFKLSDSIRLGLLCTYHFFFATISFADKNFDDRIAYEELYSWWDAAGAYGTRNSRYDVEWRTIFVDNKKNNAKALRHSKSLTIDILSVLYVIKYINHSSSLSCMARRLRTAEDEAVTNGLSFSLSSV